MTTSLLPTGTDELGMVDLEGLKKLIALQEARPARASPLSPAQLRAVDELNRATQAAIQALSLDNMPDTEPDLGDRDWVSLLHQYRNARPDGRCIEFTEEPLKNTQYGGLMWVASTRLSEARDICFPNHPVPFAKKKDAKKYAARHAVEWLMAQQLMPADGQSVTFKKQYGQNSPPIAVTTKAAAAAHALQSLAISNAQSPTASQLTNAKPPPPTTLSSGEGNDSSSGQGKAGDNYVAQVTKLCSDLGYGQPKYVVSQVENTANLFDGVPDWGDELRVPASVGVVKSVYSRKAAKSKMAESIIPYLEKVREERREKYRSILNGVPGLTAVPASE